MIFKTTEIGGAYTVELDKRADSRGFFARGWCCQEFDDRGLPNRLLDPVADVGAILVASSPHIRRRVPSLGPFMGAAGNRPVAASG